MNLYGEKKSALPIQVWYYWLFHLRRRRCRRCRRCHRRHSCCYCCHFFFSFYLCIETHFIIQYSFWNTFEILYVRLVAIRIRKIVNSIQKHTCTQTNTQTKTATYRMALINWRIHFKVSRIRISSILVENRYPYGMSMFHWDPSWLLAVVFFLNRRCILRLLLTSKSQHGQSLPSSLYTMCNERPVFRNVNAKLERSLKQNQK